MYKLLNMIPLIWGNACTLEWRVHPPTQNIHKILNWLFISFAIVKYAEKHKNFISNWGSLVDVNLNSIMKDIYSPELSNILNRYIQWRKDYMTNMDPKGALELREDLTRQIPFSVLS